MKCLCNVSCGYFTIIIRAEPLCGCCSIGTFVKNMIRYNSRHEYNILFYHSNFINRRNRETCWNFHFPEITNVNARENTWFFSITLKTLNAQITVLLFVSMTASFLESINMWPQTNVVTAGYNVQWNHIGFWSVVI